MGAVGLFHINGKTDRLQENAQTESLVRQFQNIASSDKSVCGVVIKKKILKVNF